MRFSKTNTVNETIHSNQKKHYLPYGVRTAVILLVICTLAFTSLSSTFFMSSAIAADLNINMTRNSGEDIIFPELKGQYDAAWSTSTTVKFIELSIFNDKYENAHQQITVAGENGEKVIAPGTANSYKFAVLNTWDDYLDYKIIVDAKVTGLENYPGKQLPVEVRLKGIQGWMLGSDKGTDREQWKTVYKMNNLEESAVLCGKGHAIYTLDWRWKFEQDDLSAGDALDTWLANHNEPVTLTINITTQAALHGSDSGAGGGSNPAIVAPIPDILEKELHMPYIFGYEDGTVRPLANITRAEVGAILFRLLTEEMRNEYLTTEHIYSDVPEDAWYRTSIATLSNMGIYRGYPDGTFRGNQTITRAELSALLARISKMQGYYQEQDTSFKDISHHWAEADIKLIESFNWVVGYEDRTFRPDRNITRAETVAMFNRVLHRTPERTQNLLESGNVFIDNQDKSKWYYIDIQEASHGHDYNRLLGTREIWTVLWQ